MSKLPNPLIQSLAPRVSMVSLYTVTVPGDKKAQQQSQQRASWSLEAKDAVRSEMSSRYNTQPCFLNPYGDEGKC